MEIIVCLKQVFDTEEKILLDQGRVVEDGVKFVINPYDEYAVEEAVRQKEQHGGSVTVIAVGPDRAETALRTALAMGADQAVHIWEDALSDADEYVISQVLAAAISQRSYDLVLAGYMAVDNGAAQGGPRLAEELNIPHVSTAIALNIQENQVTVERDVEGDTEIVEAELPMLVTTQQGLNEPRYPSLPGIMKAKRKPLERLTCTELGLTPEQLKSRVALVGQGLPPPRKDGVRLSGTAEEIVKQLVSKLRTDDKVI